MKFILYFYIIFSAFNEFGREESAENNTIFLRRGRGLVNNFVFALERFEALVAPYFYEIKRKDKYGGYVNGKIAPRVNNRYLKWRDGKQYGWKKKIDVDIQIASVNELEAIFSTINKLNMKNKKEPINEKNANEDENRLKELNEAVLDAARRAFRYYIGKKAGDIIELFVFLISEISIINIQRLKKIGIDEDQINLAVFEAWNGVVMKKISSVMGHIFELWKVSISEKFQRVRMLNNNAKNNLDKCRYLAT